MLTHKNRTYRMIDLPDSLKDFTGIIDNEGDIQIWKFNEGMNLEFFLYITKNQMDKGIEKSKEVTKSKGALQDARLL